MRAGRSASAALAATFLLIAPACSSRGAALPRDAHILPADQVPNMLAQCSRAAPRAGQGGWRPAAEEVAALEAKLPAELKQRQPGEDWSRFPKDWSRQYVGIVRDGRRFVYGNFFPHLPADLKVDLSRLPAGVCDGGPHFFGVELDVQSGRISHLAFNGSV